MGSARTLEATRARETQGCVPAFDVITIEAVSLQPVLSGDDRDICFQGRGSLPFKDIAAPNFNECTVTEEPHIARSASRRMIFVSRLFGHFNLDRLVAF